MVIIKKGEYVFNKFAEQMREVGRPETTIRGYLSDLTNAQRKEVINDDLTLVNMERLRGLPISIKTQHRWLSAIKKYAKFMARNNFITSIPVSILYAELPPQTKEVFNIVPREKINLEHKDLEIKALLHILYSTGARIDSISRLKLADIGESSLTFHKTKNKVSYSSVLLPSTKKAINEYISSKSLTNYLFITEKGERASSDLLRKRLRKAMGRNYINPHMYRHRLATDLIENGMSIYDVSETLNHSQISTTMSYISSSIKSKKLKLAKVHPMLVG